MTRLYAILLRLLPDEVRARHGEQMADVFAALLRDAGRTRGAAGRLRVALTEIAALVRFAWRERRAAPPPPRVDERLLAWPAGPERRPRMLASLAQDLRYAARVLRRTPGFTAVCLATIALAIGANSAIFSVVNAVLLESLPYRDADRIVALGHRLADGSRGLGRTTPGNFYDWQTRATAFESMAGYAYTERIITHGDSAERVLGTLSAGSLFDVLGRGAAEGRVFSAAEDGPGAEAVIVLSHGFARRLYGERSAIGRTLGVGGVPFTVIGVMPADFAFPDYDAMFWIPARFDAAFRTNRDQYFLLSVARLAPGATVDQARAQLDTVMDAIRRDHPRATESATAGVVPMKELLVGGVRTRLLTLMGAVACILLIACVNLGNLLLGRAASRRREVAVRHALGARPLRLVRQLVTESLLLAAVGGAAGLALGYVLLDVLVAWLPEGLPRAEAIALDLKVVAFAAAASLAAGLAFGLYPALQLASPGVADVMREGARASGRSARVRSALVTVEVAAALVMLAGAGLLVRSFGNLLDVDPGFRSTQLLTFRVGLPGDTYREMESRVRFFEEILERVRRLPGVDDAAISSYLPVSGYGTGAWFNRLDRPLPPDKTPPGVAYRVVSSNYFETLGIALRRGRLLTERDGRDGRRAVVVSEAAARRFWPGEDPIGKQIYLGAPDNRLFPDAEVVGIVADVAQLSLDAPGAEAVYGTHRLMPFWSNFSFAVRTTIEPEQLTGAVRAQVREVDRAVPIFNVRTMDDVIALSTAAARSSMLLMGLFAALALVLAVIGVFGVLSYTVSQRTAELGIRMALGATGRSVTLLVLAQGMAPVAAGIALGIAGGLALTRLMGSLLFGVGPEDPATFAAVSMLLATVAALASYVPARRATRVDPVAVLRQQ